jgi:hypothetical protein
MGLNFGHFAAGSRDAKRWSRDLRHAQEAYDGALKQFGTASRSEELEVSSSENGDTTRASLGEQV